MARRTKLNRELIGKISDGIAEGATVKSILRSLDIQQSTYYYWLERAETARNNINEKTGKAPKGENIYLELLGSIERAYGQLERELIKPIRYAKGWQSKAWLLEKRFPEEYGHREKVEHSGKMEQVHKDELENMTEEELKEKEKELERTMKALQGKDPDKEEAKKKEKKSSASGKKGNSKKKKAPQKSSSSTRKKNAGKSSEDTE